MFAGRREELLLLEQMLYQAKLGNPIHLLIDGERGIGKSSMLLYLDRLARGDLQSLDGERFRFVTANVELEAQDAYPDIIKKLGLGVHHAATSCDQLAEMARRVWDFVTRWEAAGIKYKSPARPQESHELLHSLAEALAQTASDASMGFDGILLLIDEADQPSADSHLGQLVKVLTERLARLGCGSVCLAMAGQATLRQRLAKSHASAPRVFNAITLKPLQPNERFEVVEKGLQEARERNCFEVSITGGAAELIPELSEGYPHFIQEFAYCAFDQDTDNEIDTVDVLEGAIKENGAFHQLGVKYFYEQYFEQIWSNDYRLVLREMAEYFDGWVTREQIQRATKLRSSTIDNALVALKRRHIIIPRQGVRGEYRLPTKAFAAWIKAYARAHATVENPSSDETEL